MDEVPLCQPAEIGDSELLPTNGADEGHKVLRPIQDQIKDSETLSYGSIQRMMSAHLERGTNTSSSNTASDNSRLLSEQRVEEAALVLRDSVVVSTTKCRAVGGVGCLALCGLADMLGLLFGAVEGAMGTETTIAEQGNTCYRRSRALLQKEQKKSTREQPKIGRRKLQALVDDIT
ncbi:hypothetical protein BHE74_00031828 [Ensete ventricosum]|nr:hypothetical protein BHE74_00031828 [Ensete ventricosum]